MTYRRRAWRYIGVDVIIAGYVAIIRAWRSRYNAAVDVTIYRHSVAANVTVYVHGISYH